MRRELSFWLTIALVSIAAVALLKLAARSGAGDKIPGLAALADLIAS